jgi:hypothetical protein
VKARLVSSVTGERPKLENRVCSSADSILLATEVDFNVTRIAQTSCIGLSLFLKGCAISPFRDSRSQLVWVFVDTMFVIANRTLGEEQTIFSKVPAEFLNLATDF